MSTTAAEIIPTRASLLNRLKNWEDQSSWQDFFDTYWKLIYNIARKGGLTPEESQDVVQETLVSVAKHMPSFNYDPAVGSFKAWLLKLTRWRIADQLRKRKGAPAQSLSHEDTDSDLIGNLIDPASERLDELWNQEWEKNLLDAAIANTKRRLDPAKYQIFDFYVNKQWPPEKVAEAFGISVSQVYLAKHRISEMIKAEVQRLEKSVI